ncbi:hypothetical protein EDD85DRAFT_166432 [Armillaria nabsnona]|nr:hypothetical protein EDD85DRAFT_166432 [Armillaria nabsnona]
MAPSIGYSRNGCIYAIIFWMQLVYLLIPVLHILPTGATIHSFDHSNRCVSVQALSIVLFGNFIWPLGHGWHSRSVEHQDASHFGCEDHPSVIIFLGGPARTYVLQRLCSVRFN